MTITSILIANRGEIAIRIARTAAELGFSTVGICPDDDARSLHTRRMDKVRRLPGNGAAAYLDIEAIVAAARGAGCDAVHPGYGFLSENPDFARAVEAAGLVFVGPSPDTLALFGDKTTARTLACQCDVPVPPGTESGTSKSQAAAFLERHGNVMIKAAAGGGGRGMRMVSDGAALPDALERCEAEARAAFGNGAIYLEAVIPEARHIEVQIVGDGTGAITHLGERECSLQRHHQKIFEIAPAPGLSPAMRSRLIGAAVRMAEQVRYRSLGTFEFLVQDNAYYFIEANARLQVEHTVTEAVLGLDIVDAQLRIAGGATLEQLGLRQPAIPAPRGHAIQLRVNMETMMPDGAARPEIGVITAYEPPSGPGIRVDGFGYAGYQTSSRFDSLLAKLIVSHPSADYAETIARARRALSEFRIEGVATNLPFLAALLRHPDVVANRISTRFIDTHAAALVADRTPPDRFFPAPSATRAAAFASGPPGTDAIVAPMAGQVVAIDVTEGQTVRRGEQVVVLEAMKMQHVVVAPAAGIVRQIAATIGDVMATDQPMVFLEPRDGSDEAAGEGETIDLDSIRPDLAEAHARHALTFDPARREAVEKRHRQGGRSVRENVDDLVDPGSFIEYGGLILAAQRSRRSMDELLRMSPGDGVVAGLGTVNAADFGEEAASTVVVAYDYSVLAGTQGTMNHKKQDRVYQLAEELGRPLVLFAEGGGGRPGDTDKVLLHASGLNITTFHAFGRLSGHIPLVGIVHGRCFAGNAALLGCCDVIIADESSTIGMGGPAMIEGGGLGVYKPEEVGPVSVQVPNGVIDILVRDEAEAVSVAKRYLSYFQGTLLTWDCADQRLLRRAVPENRLRVYDIRALIATLADTGSVLELRPGFGLGMITALIRLEGVPFGLIANNPRHLGGAIDAEAADKAARFMQLCDAHGLPMISLCDTPGFMVGPEAETHALVRRVCRMFVNGANLSVPLFVVVPRKGYGLGAQAMAGGSYAAPAFTVAWPSGEFGGMGLEGAVRLAFRNELASIEDLDARDAEFRRRVDEMYAKGKALAVASIMEIDNVIDPADTRRWIVRGLKMHKPGQGARKRRSFIDTW
ncbi:MAG: carbamoyl-phosphate synthase large subunit [Acetobacteraceae bacterium]|nr:carbamoyl-phosphate synthase large subunit [Acetobacteraceae bacterium]